MAITCALGDKHIKALTSVISKAMLNASEKGEAFDIYAFMNNLYSNLKERQGMDNAIQYMQQVPYIANRIDAKLEIELSKDVNGNEISLKALSKSFRDQETGVNTVINFFEKTLSPEQLAIMAGDNANKPIEQYTNPQEDVEFPEPSIEYGDDRLKTSNIFSGTHEEFVAAKPGTIDETVDQSKLYAINTIGRISILSRDMDVLDSIKLDGVTLKLKPVVLTQINESDRTDYSNNLIKRQNVLKGKGLDTGEVTPAKEQIALVITDTNGNYVYFAKNGKVTTKEEGGKIVYQMLRDVRESDGRYTAMDIYGRENQIISPEKEALRRLKLAGLSKPVNMSLSDFIKEIDEQQQNQLKQIYDFKKKMLSKSKDEQILLNLVGASAGVFNFKVAKNIKLSNLSNFLPEIAQDVIKSLNILSEPFGEFKSGRAIVQIKGDYFELDRSVIKEETAKKIAQVLTNPKIKAKQKLAFYHQFFTDEKIDLPSSIQRHNLFFDNKELVFAYVPHTKKQVEKNPSLAKENSEPKAIDLNNPKAAEDIEEILLSGWSTNADKIVGSKIAYKKNLITNQDIEEGAVDKDQFFDYQDGKFIPANYIDFLLQQEGQIEITPQKTLPLFNSHLKFNLDNAFAQEVNKAKEAISTTPSDIRSEVRKFKDSLVEELKATPGLTLNAEVVNVSETNVKDSLGKIVYYTYTVTVKIDGKEGKHKFYQSRNKPVVGDKLSIGLNPVEVKNGYGFPNNISAFVITDNKINYFGDLAETDFSINEPKRLPVPMQQDYVAEQMETEALNEVTEPPKTVTEEESNVQVEQGLNPSNTANPADESRISNLFKRFKLDRNTSLPKGVTAEQIENALNWYDKSPLKKYLGELQMINIVNSDAYARFVTAGSTLIAGQYTGQLGQIQINEATGGSVVDAYHEAWHAFSQLFLTKQEKTDLYNELKKSNPKYKNYSFLELEELLAEDFRSYALNQKTKPSSPKRNTLFRRILNFLKKLFGGETSISNNLQPYNIESEGVAGEYFKNLYLASNSPELLNIYTPSIDNVMFDILNRGITQVKNNNELALNSKDSVLVNDSLDSILSDIVDDNYKSLQDADPSTVNKNGTIRIITDKNNREIAYEIAKERFIERLKHYRSKLKITAETPFSSFTSLKNLEDNASAVIKSKKGDNKYIFLKSQVEDFNNLSLDTKGGQRVKGEKYKKNEAKKTGIEIIGDFYTHNNIKDSTGENASIIIVDTIEEAKAQYDAYVQGGAKTFESFKINPLIDAKSTYELSRFQSQILDNIRVLQSAINNWESVVKYNQENSTYEIVKKEFNIQKTDDKKSDAADISQSEKFDSGIGKETLFELSGKDVVYILKSLHKKAKVNNNLEDELNELGFKKLANFKQIWQAIVKATRSAKDPQTMYDRIVEASANFPELQQLVNYKLPNPNLKNTSYEFDIVSSFWSVFSLPRVEYKQLSLYDEGGQMTTEVSSGSLDTTNIVKSFQSNFQSNKNNPYVRVASNNTSYLNINKLVEDFSTQQGKFDDKKTIEFLSALGITLDDTPKIKEEITKINRRDFFGVPFIFETIKEVNNLDKKGNKTESERDFLTKFKINPILELTKGIPAKMIGGSFYEKGSQQKTQISRIAELQIQYGNATTSMSASNAEGNKVNEHTTDNTLTFLADALNTVRSRTDMFREGSPLRYLNPKNNPWSSSSITLKNLFTVGDARNNAKRINVVQVSGTQRTDVDINEGQNTTNLSAQGKLIQDFHTLLKSGIVETMRPGSKSSAWSWYVEGGIQVNIGTKNEPYLYADIDSFIPQTGGERDVIEDTILPYLDSELKRINIFKTNPEAKNYVGYKEKANQQGEAFGEIFNVFNGVLKIETQNKLKKLITDPNVSLLDYLDENTELKNEIIKEIASYFNNKTNELFNQYQKAPFYDPKLINKLSNIDVPLEQKQKILLKAFFVNNWIHNVETMILFFTGDIAQLDHSKENGHKRTSGLISNGPRVRTDIAAQIFVSDVNEGGFANSTYARSLPKEGKYDNFRYDGYLNTAVIADISRDSIYMPEIRKRLEADVRKTNPKLSDQKVKEIVDRRVSKYSKNEIKEGDGQGYITIDAYRTLKKLQNKWSPDQERLYQKVIKGEEISIEDLQEGFPVYKLQNFGFAENTVLPVGIMHKFALFPLIPSAIKGTELEELHKRMLQQNIQYVTFASGSKTGGITPDGKHDQIFEEGSKKLKSKFNFTNNRIHAGFLKEATNVPSKFKGEVIFSTQLRKLILDGLYEHGSVTSERARDLVDRYKGVVDFYSQVLKKDLENEIGYRKDEKGTYIGKPKKFLKLIQRNLEQKDYPAHVIDSLKVNKDGTLNYDLSYFIDTEGIENIVMSIINKKLVKQKVNGEALVQVASSMWNGTWDSFQGTKFQNLKGKELEEATRKYLGTNNLPFYTEGEDGNTSAMKVAIALQGDFFNLLNLLHVDGEKIGTRERLNEMIKNEDWLNTDDNRKSITMTAVRIPVQGLNSMEFMEVYEFLDPTAQNVIILPTEIVAKSGGDYDVDKLTTFMPNINKDGSYVRSSVSKENFSKEVTALEANGKDPASFISNQKKATQNEMIESIKSILEIPENYASLMTPNDTDILKPIADDLQKDVSAIDKYAKVNGDAPNVSAKGKPMISQTSMFEVLYNNGKFGANMGGKAVLGIFANDNALNPLLNSVGTVMPSMYKEAKFNNALKRMVEEGPEKYNMRLFLPHRTYNGKISLSNITNLNGNKIAELYSQGVNGSVDVEADEWIFYIQGNLEVASVLSYLIKSGVPEDTAAYFVSNPLVRDYAERQRLASGVFGSATGMGSSKQILVPYDSANYVYSKYIPQYITNRLKNIADDQELVVTVSEPTPTPENPRKRTDQEYSYYKSNLLEILPTFSIDNEYIKSIYIKDDSATDEDKGIDDERLIYLHLNPSTKGFYDTSSFTSKQTKVLEKGEFNKNNLKSLITTKEGLSPEQIDTAVAAFAHFLEIEKQIHGLAALKRQIKPDVNTIRTSQEAVMRSLNLDLLFNSSKVDTDSAERAINESIISKFGDTEIIEKILMPMMPLVNGDSLNSFVLNSIGGFSKNEKNKIETIIKFYGSGSDGITKFINSFKTGLKTFIFQNYLTNFIDKQGSITNLPNMYNDMPVKINNNLPTDVAIQNGEYIINQKRILSDFYGKKYLTGNTESNNYDSRDGIEAFDLSNDVFDTYQMYTKYVMEREALSRTGLTGEELNRVALIRSFNPSVILGSNKYSYTDALLSLINKHKKNLSKKYSVIDQIRKAVEVKDANVLTLSDKQTQTGADQSRYATEIKALGNSRIMKVDDPEENAKISMMFRLLPLISIYQHGVGRTLYGFDLALPVDGDYIEVMKSAGDLFKNNYYNAKTFNLIFKKLTSSKSRNKNFVVTEEEYNQYTPERIQESELQDVDENEVFETNTVGTTQPTGTPETLVPGLKKINQVKPESISNVKEMSFNELGTFTFTVGESEYQVSPKKNDAGDIKFNIFKYDDNSGSYKLVKNPKTNRSLTTEEASDFLSKNLPEDFIKFVINLYNNRKHANLNLPSKRGATKLNPNPIAIEASSLMDSYLFQKPMREQTYDGSDFPILLTIEEVNKKFEEYYSDELRAGIKKYLEPFAKDELIKSIKFQEEKLDTFNERGSADSTKKNTKMYIEDLKNALKNFTSAQPTVQPGLSGNQLLNKVGDVITQTSKLKYKTVNLPGIIRKIEKTENGYNVTLNIKGYDGGRVINVIIENGKVVKSIQKNPLKVGEFLENTTSTYDFKFSEPISTQPTAPVNYNEVPKVQVQPKLEPGRFVTFDNNTWIVTKQNENGTWQIYNPNLEGAQAKKSVAEKNLGIRSEIAKIVNYRGQDYLVTPNETIISLVSNKKMNWASNDGNRIGILQLAKESISSTQQTIMPTSSEEDAGQYEFKLDDTFTITTPFKLNEEQKQALLGLVDFFNDPKKYNNEIALIGYAGTGKTTIMGLFDKYLKKKGIEPKYSSPTHRANAVTKLNNPKADVITLHSLFGLAPDVDLTSGQISIEKIESKLKFRPKVTYGDYLIIDESSMITDQLYKFIENYKNKDGIKVVYMGDPAQLAPVDTKKEGTSVSVALEKPQKLNLTKVERTGDNPILEESTNLRLGKPLTFVSNEIDGKGVEYTSSDARVNQIIGDSLSEMVNTNDFLGFRILSAKNESIRPLNNKARKQLFGDDSSKQIVKGDLLMGYSNFGSNSQNYDVYNSGDYRVVNVSEEKTITAKTETTQGSFSFIGYDVLLENVLDPSKGPISIFIAKNGVNNTSAKKLIKAISEIAIKANTAKSNQARNILLSQQYQLKALVAFMEDQINDFGQTAMTRTLDYGYAHSIHKSQGGTYGKVLIYLDTIERSKFDKVAKQQLKYVAVSRAKDYVYIATNPVNVVETSNIAAPAVKGSEDIVTSSTSLEELTKGRKTVASKPAADLPMDITDVEKIINGTKIITNKTGLYSDGIYTIGGIQQVELKYLGKAVVVSNSVVIVDERDKKTYSRPKDDFAKAEGFKNWADFEANSKFSKNFISGSVSRYVYLIKPIGEIKEEIGVGQKLDSSNPVIAAFNQKLVETKGALPKEFIFQNGSYPNKYILTPNYLYNLVDIDSGSVYLRNINLQTGEIVQMDEPTIPVDKKRVNGIINSLREQVKSYKIDEILAEKGIDLNQELDKLENVSTESELNAIMLKINKNMC